MVILLRGEVLYIGQLNRLVPLGVGLLAFAFKA
jgi:hypothetical protein